ncbi:MAG TPA: hypothetical protein VHE61_20450 [Opitutaceae bacterium]|nr:hypothetical protein [Opitutaceae bacterium]
MPARSAAFACAIALGSLFPGCSRPDPSLQSIDARNYGAFYYWRSSVSSHFTPQRWSDFHDAIQELRFEAMARGVTGTDAINEALCARINGRTVAEVFRMADEGKLTRLRTERDQLKTMVDSNALLAPRPGDAALADDLGERRTNQQDRLRALVAEIAATRQHLIAQGGHPSPEPPIDLRPAVLSRDEAKRELSAMIRARLATAALMYGDWPAKIDRTGSKLVDADRESFREKQDIAPANGHVVIPVYLRASWWIYDAKVNYPEFSSAVTQNLTAADRHALQVAWADSEAEIWARKQASLEPAAEAERKMKAQLEAVLRP